LRVHPKLFVCGHFHSGNHELQNVDGIYMANVSYIDESYEDSVKISQKEKSLIKDKLIENRKFVINFLQQNGKFLQPFEIDLLVDRLDKDQDGMINYNEFVEEFALKC